MSAKGAGVCLVFPMAGRPITISSQKWRIVGFSTKLLFLGWALSLMVFGKTIRMNFPIRSRMFLGFLVAMFLTGAIVIVSLTHFSKLDATLRELIREEPREVHAIWNIRNLLSGIETNLTHVLIGEDVETHLAQMRSKQSAISASLSGFRQFHSTLPAEPKKIFSELTAQYSSFEESTKDVIALVKTGRMGNAKALLVDVLATNYRTTLESLDRLLKFEERRINQTVAGALAEGQSDWRTIAILSVVAALLSVALAFGIAASLTKPINKLVEATERVARGDLTAQAEISRADEIGLLAERFNAMVTRLNRLISNQQRFYADASHELRTPLTVLRGEADVALRGPESIGDYREALKRIVGVTQQMGTLVDELLFLARSEAGHIAYETQSVELDSLLSEVADLSDGLANLKGVDLKVRAEKPVTIWGDRQRLRQLFFNLTDNAIKYTGQGGKVGISLDSRIGMARVRVTDSGIGIEEDSLLKVFERFYRGDAARSAHEGGTGLGLAIAKSIVDAHNGQIVIDSTAGCGTVVTVTLPNGSPQV